MRRIRTDTMLLICVLSWALNFTATKYGQTHGFTPLAYGALQLTIGAIMLAAIAYQREHTLRFERSALPRLLGVASILFAGNQLAFTLSFHFASATVIALLFGTMPIVALLLAAAFGLERIGAKKSIAATVSFAGVAFVARGSVGDASSSFTGILLGLTSPATFVAYSMALAPLLRRYTTYRVNALAALIAVGPVTGVSVPALTTLHWGGVSGLAWVCLLYSAAAFALPNLLWLSAIDRVGAPRATLWANMQPFVGAIFALLILSEQVTSLTFVGGGALAAGVVIARLPIRARGRSLNSSDADARPVAGSCEPT